MRKVVHFEIPSEIPASAKKFYKEIFGWKINEIPGMNYTVVNTGPTDEKGMLKEKGFINGGIRIRDNDIKYPVIIIDVDDINAVLKKIAKYGGEVIQPKMNVGDIGYNSYFKDSEGNVMGLWQNKTK